MLATLDSFSNKRLAEKRANFEMKQIKHKTNKTT